MPVQYWNGKTKRRSFVNTRVVLLDLVLSREDANRPRPEKFAKAIEALSQIQTASIVIVVSNAPEEPSDFQEDYERAKGKFPGVIANEKIRKGSLTDHPSTFVEKIEAAIAAHPDVRLAFLLESIIDSAKDGAFKATLGANADVVAALVKMLDQQVSVGGPRRGLVDAIIRILSRHAHDGKEYDELEDVLDSMLESEPPSLASAGGSLLSKLMYYKPEREQVWVGDLYETRKPDGRDMGIVLTPPCDLAWQKTEFVTVALGFKLTEDVYRNYESVFFQREDSLKRLVSEERSAMGRRKVELGRAIRNRIDDCRNEGKSLPEGCLVLRHVNFDRELMDVLIDLKDIERVPVKRLEKQRNWTRITRLDSPFAEELLQRFGDRTSRIGVPDYNLSMLSLKEKMKRH